jgi:hypothetical protein
MDVKMKAFLFISLLLGSQAWAGWSVSHYNIRNFNKDPGAGATDLVQLGKNIKAFKSDVMEFVEVVNEAAFKTLIQTNLPGYQPLISTCGGFGKQKLAIAYNSKVFNFISSAEDMNFSGTGSKCGSLRPAFIVTLEHIATKKAYVFAALHLKAGGAESAMRTRWAQYQLLAKLSQVYANQNLILLGDLNTTGYNIKDADYDNFQSFLAVSKMTTASQNLHCTSYWEGTLGNGLHQSSILDHVVVKNSMTRDIASVEVGAHCAKLNCVDATPADLGTDYLSVSDHCPIQVTFK